MKTKLRLIVDGGNATPAPPLGPQLTQLGLKPGEVIKKINDETKKFTGMKVPVELEVDRQTKEYALNVLMPTVAQLLIKAAGIEKGFGDRASSASVSLENVKSIAKDHSKYSLAKDERGLVNEVLGTCLSLGLKVDGKSPKEFIQKPKP